MKFIQIKILLINNARERDYTFVINEGFFFAHYCLVCCGRQRFVNICSTTKNYYFCKQLKISFLKCTQINTSK